MRLYIYTETVMLEKRLMSPYTQVFVNLNGLMSSRIYFRIVSLG